MAAAQHSIPKWADPDSAWSEDDDDVVAFERPVIEVDRNHNHEEMSPEAMAQAISDLRATIESMDGRLAGLEDGAAAIKGLGGSMVQMGDALTKRMKSLEDAATAAAEAEVARQAALEAEAARAAAEAALFVKPARPAKAQRARWIIGGLGVAAVIALAVVMLRPHAPARAPAAPPQVLYAPNAPAS